MGDIRTQRPDDKPAGLVGGREVGKIDQQSKIAVGCPHLGCKLRRIGSGADQRRLIHIVVEYLQLDHHPFARRIIANRAGGFQELCKRLLSGLRRPLARQESDPPRADTLCLVNRFQKGGFGLFASLLVEVIRVELRPKQPGLRTVADGQMALGQQLNRLFPGLPVRKFPDLDRVKEIVTGDLPDRGEQFLPRMAHPLDGSNLKIAVDGFVHIGFPFPKADYAFLRCNASRAFSAIACASR